MVYKSPIFPKVWITVSFNEDQALYTAQQAEMHVAVISNLHGNLLALASVLSKIERLREKGRK